MPDNEIGMEFGANLQRTSLGSRPSGSSSAVNRHISRQQGWIHRQFRCQGTESMSK